MNIQKERNNIINPSPSEVDSLYSFHLNLDENLSPLIHLHLTTYLLHKLQRTQIKYSRVRCQRPNKLSSSVTDVCFV